MCTETNIKCTNAVRKWILNRNLALEIMDLLLFPFFKKKSNCFYTKLKVILIKNCLLYS